jgi:hypothetical protein
LIRFFRRYGLRLRRKAWVLRAALAGRRLAVVADRTAAIAQDEILLVSTLRNEAARLPAFLRHYRALGVGHFLIVDNASSDGSSAMLRGQPDVSLWHTADSYRAARYGADWMMALLARHGTGHWVLIVDPDELLVYAHCDTRPLAALTGWLEAAGQRAFPAVLLDLYPGPEGAEGSDQPPSGPQPPPEKGWFDPASLCLRANRRMGNLWVQGGPRARAFFATHPRRAPALNKTPLVRWKAGDALASSTHGLLPPPLNRSWDARGGLAASGCLLHTKFLSPFEGRASEESARAQHYGAGREYAAYRDGLAQGARLWSPASRPYRGWRDLEDRGLLSAGDWA